DTWNQIQGAGAFVIDTKVPGEQVHLIENIHYWDKSEGVSDMIISIVPIDFLGVALISGFDVAINLRNEECFNNIDGSGFGINIMQVTTNEVSSLMFNFNNHYRTSDNPVHNIDVRRAISYSIDTEIFTQLFHLNFLLFEETGFNIGEANSILNNAGFWRCSNGGNYRLDHNGNELYLTLLMVDANLGHDLTNSIYQLIKESFWNIGIRLELLEGRFFQTGEILENVRRVDIIFYNLNMLCEIEGLLHASFMQLFHANDWSFFSAELEWLLYEIVANPASWDIDWLNMMLEQLHYYLSSNFYFPASWRLRLNAAAHPNIGGIFFSPCNNFINLIFIYTSS
ncbi:MAG: ABC transporter substrate-binding protein, partial [Firmicutes bacterium]|nr:ABC transporter substrate-binding protein [Bacillota bacterium]